MNIPDNAVIPLEKLTNYLLRPRPIDDKSKFLTRMGFTREKPELLLTAIRELAQKIDAAEDGSNAYGVFYRMTGKLDGPNGASRDVVLIWICWHLDQSFHFVTLKPLRG